MDARWHSLSDNHIVVLSDDALRIFDVRATDPATPCDEWLFPSSGLSSRPVALACGAARGWELLTLFVLCEDASVYYVTPLLPTGALLPAADWAELLARSDSDAAAPLPLPPAPGARYASALAQAARVTATWLRVSFVAVPGEPAWLRHVPSATDGTHGTLSARRLAPALQGPIETAPARALSWRAEGQFARPPAADLLPVSPALLGHPALLVAGGDGRVLALVAPELLAPAWGPAVRSEYRGGAKSTLAAVPAGALLAGVDVHDDDDEVDGGGDGTGSRISAAGRSVAAPWLVVDALRVGGSGATHPLAVAASALEAGGGTWPGAPPLHGQLESDDGRDDAGQRVSLPYLVPDSVRPDTFFLALRAGIYCGRILWADAVRNLLAGGDGGIGRGVVNAGVGGGAAGGTFVYRVLGYGGGADDDVVGVATAPLLQSADRGDGADNVALPSELVAWTVPAYACTAASTSPAVYSLRDGSGGSGGVSLTGVVQCVAALPAASAAAVALGSAGHTDSGAADGEPSTAPLHALPPFTSVIAEYRPFLARATAAAGDRRRVTVATTSESPLEALATVAETTQETATALRKLQGRIAARAAALAAATSRIEADVAATTSDLAEVVAAGTSAAARLRLLSGGAANLRSRAEAVAYALALRRGILSRAEAAFGAEVRSLAAEATGRIPAMLERLEAGVVQLQDADASAAASGDTSLSATALSDVHSKLSVIVEATHRSVGRVHVIRAGIDEMFAAAGMSVERGPAMT